MQRHPNIVVKAENTPFGEYRQKYVAQAAGNALPDIMYCQFSWAQEFIKNGLFRPLDDYIAREKDFNLQDFTPQSLVSYQRDGKLWGIPYDEGPANLYYNKDIFDAAGIPYPDETWDLEKLKEVALKLTQGEGPNKIFGLGELPTLGDSLVAPPYLMPFGAQYLREPKEDECLINKPEAVAALEWWQELRDKGAVPSPADLQNVAWPAFQFGKIAMTLQGSWATPPIRAGAKFNWDIAMWPRGPKAHVTFSAGSAYMITRDSKNPDAAWIYLNEYLSTAGQSYMWGITGRGSPARLSAWPSYLNSKFAPPGAKYVEQAMRTIASHDIIDQPTGPQVTQAAGPIWDLVVAGQLSVKEACDQVFAAVDPNHCRQPGVMDVNESGGGRRSSRLQHCLRRDCVWLCKRASGAPRQNRWGSPNWGNWRDAKSVNSISSFRSGSSGSSRSMPDRFWHRLPSVSRTGR